MPIDDLSKWLRPRCCALAVSVTVGCFATPAWPDLVEVAVSGDATTVTLPAQPAGNVTVRLYVLDADFPDEGSIIVNRNEVQLFGASGIAANNDTLAWIDVTMPASYWHKGWNAVQFLYARHDNSYRVDLLQIEYQPAALAIVQTLQAAGRAPLWLDENDEIMIRLRPSSNRVYMCIREDGSPTGRRFLAWTPGDQLEPDYSQPLAPVTSCDTAICFAADDASSTRDQKITQACGTAE